MLKTFAVALLAIAMPVGLAQAHGMGHHMHRHMVPGCGRASPQRRRALAVRRLITVRCCVTRGNGVTPRKRARCECTHRKLG